MHPPSVARLSHARRPHAGAVHRTLTHQTQRIEPLPDGRIRLSFKAPNLMPVVSWILEWGPHARAVEPQELVELVKRELEQARALY